jgi:hypothetical protein
MKSLWKYIASLVPCALPKYLLLVIAHAKEPLIVERWAEKEKKETEKELSEDDDNGQEIASVGKFKRWRNKLSIEFVIFLPTDACLFFSVGKIVKASHNAPTSQGFVFAQNPLYIYFCTWLI